MSVFLAVKMDIDVTKGTFEEITEKAFPLEAGVARMLKLPTLQWKLWCNDPVRNQSSGFYLFASREAAEAYAHQAVRMLQDRPGISNVTAQLWNIYEEHTRRTMGPIDLPMIQDVLK